MSVLAAISGGDFGRSTTTSTTFTIWDEIRGAQGVLVEKDIQDLISTPFDLAGFSSGTIMALQVEVPPDAKPAEIRAWGATRALNLTVQVAIEPELSVLCPA
jgi:hypothetical protein